MVKRRRRAQRKSGSEYDRSADTFVPVRHLGEDGERAVVFEEDAEPLLTGREFYDYQRPPHHGG